MTHTTKIESFINDVLNAAPEGVNIKAEVKKGDINFYILNAPAPLYDFTPEEWGAGRRFVELSKAQKTNEAAAELWQLLRGVAQAWRKKNGLPDFQALAFVGSPRKSFIPIAKNTARPRVKPAPVVGVKLPATLSERDKKNNIANVGRRVGCAGKLPSHRRSV